MYTTLNNHKLNVSHPALEYYIEVTKFISAMLPDIAIGITSRDEWLAYYPSRKIDLGVKSGTKINPREPLADCIHNKRVIKEEVSAEFFGFPFTGLANPIIKDGQVIGAVAIQMQEQNEKELRRIADQIVSSVVHTNDSVSKVEKGAEGLSDISHQLLQQSVQSATEMEQTNEVITMIKKIADQTNLLGLNASIEAARAGEMGRGFDVVAKEIRKLSSETVASTEKVRSILSNLQLSMKEMAASVERVVSVGENQAASTQEISAFINEIEKMSKELNKYASQL
ncbi:methyl-accepting chemotaxis protein [Rossellomorea vietnamensis]|uniref:methyl-accepting chemotaxis protein n=1 Tax=Rossellomorea vietnamensis TaxID=218284 RepID=UPI003CEB9577